MSNITSGQHRKNLELLEQQEVDSERYQTLLPYLAALYDSAAELPGLDAFRAALKLGTAMPGKDRLTVDYGQSLKQMIAAGNYDWKNDSITSKRFSIKGAGVVKYEWKLVHFDEEIDSDQAKTRIKKDGWEVAKIEHLLAFGAAYPNEQRKYPIIALGSVVEIESGHHVLCLGSSGVKRDFRLDWWSGRWVCCCRFLAVRKISAA